MERLVRRDEYGEAKHFIALLRLSSDRAPQLLQPPVVSSSAQQQNCVVNAARFSRENAGYECVLGFKLWVMRFPAAAAAAYVAAVHAVVRHIQSGKHLDVTPADPGDEGQESVFVPSSLIYRSWTVEEIANYAELGLNPRMGGVCSGLALRVKRETGFPALFQASPRELELLLYAPLSALALHLRCADERALLARLGRAGVDDGERHCLLAADQCRDLARAAAKPTLLRPRIPAEIRAVLAAMEQEGKGVLLPGGDGEPVQLSEALLAQLLPAIRDAARKPAVLLLVTEERVEVQLRDAQALVDGAPPDTIDGFGSDVAHAVETFDRDAEVPCLLTDANLHTFLFMQAL